MGSALVRSGIAGFVGGAIPGAMVVGAELVGLGSWGIVLLAVAALVALIGGAALLAMPLKQLRQRAVRVASFSALFVLSSLAFLRASGEARDLAFLWLAERSSPIIAAIKQYEANHGRPPEALADLVPEHLPEAPSTNMRAYSSYEYEVFPPEQPRKLYWYDLGSRDGHEMAGLWVYIDGEPDHAILVVSVNQQGTVVGLEADRLPEVFEETKFERERWKDRSGRMTMVRGLVPTLDPIGKPFTEVAAALGPPDGERELLNSNWELRVPCSLGLLNWDVFFYWPSEKYPDYVYGGGVERIGRWAYVHE